MRTSRLKPNFDFALKWRGKKVRDTRTNEIGLIINATDNPVRLVGLFPGNRTVSIALEKTGDLECLVPGYARARYRVHSESD